MNWADARAHVAEVQGGLCALCLEEIAGVHHIYKLWDSALLDRFDYANLVGVCRLHHDLLEKLKPERQLQIIVEARCRITPEVVVEGDILTRPIRPSKPSKVKPINVHYPEDIPKDLLEDLRRSFCN